jgi:hypothetical protein
MVPVNRSRAHTTRAGDADAQSAACAQSAAGRPVCPPTSALPTWVWDRRRSISATDRCSVSSCSWNSDTTSTIHDATIERMWGVMCSAAHCRAECCTRKRGLGRKRCSRSCWCLHARVGTEKCAAVTAGRHVTMRPGWDKHTEPTWGDSNAARRVPGRIRHLGPS